MKLLRLLPFALCLLPSAFCLAAGWPTWCGASDRNPISAETGLPATFTPGARDLRTGVVDLTTAVGVKWAVKLGSQTFASPVVAGGHVYIGTNNGTPGDARFPPRDDRYTGDRDVLLCLDAATGALCWQLPLPKSPIPTQDHPEMGLGGTPTVEGDRVYLVTNRGEVLCLNANGMANGNTGPYRDEAYLFSNTDKPVTLGPTDADIIWRYNMVAKLQALPHDCCCSAVTIVGDRLYVATGNGRDDQDFRPEHGGDPGMGPSPDAPSLIVLDKKTGALIAQDDAGIGRRLLHGAWSSPAYAEIPVPADAAAAPPIPKGMIFYGGGDGCCYAYDAEPLPADADGKRLLKLDWSFDGNSSDKRAMPIVWMGQDGPQQIIATPVVADGCVFFAMGMDPLHGPGVWGRLWCLDAATGAPRWHYDEINRCDATVAVYNGMVFAVDFKGCVHCVDEKTGVPFWTYDVPNKPRIVATPLVADGVVYVCTEMGDLYTFSADKTLNLLGVTKLGAPCDSSPCAADGVLYVATYTTLYAVGK